jgi:hypothetical protein
VPDRQGLARAAEQHFLVGDQPPGPHGVDVDAVDDRPAGALEPGRRRVGHRAEAGVASGGSDQLRRTPRRTAGRVGLVGVVELDDLDRLVERRRFGGEAHHQHGPDGEVGSDHDAHRRRVGEEPAHGLEPLVVEAGRADDAVQAAPDAPAQMVHHRVGMGEVDDHVGQRQRVQRVFGPDAGHQLEVAGPFDGTAHLGADPAASPQHAHLDRGHREATGIVAGTGSGMVTEPNLRHPDGRAARVRQGSGGDLAG